MSKFERLPTELLEKIFLFSMSLDMPNASPVIAGKLSSEIIYSQAILFAFGPTWDRWHGQEKTFKFKGNEQGNTSDVSESDPRLQVGDIL